MKALDKHIKGKREFKKINDAAIYCQPCEETVHIKQTAVKHCINSHEKSLKHIRKFRSWAASGSQQVSIADQLHAGDSNFNRELAKFVNGCNIPWTRVNTKPFKDFFKYLGKANLPDRSTLQKHLPSIYDIAIEKIREYIGDSWIYLQVDEARIADRAIVSVLVGRLDGKQSLSHCLNIVQVETQINHTTIEQIINDSLNILWPNQIFYDRFRLLNSDQASYMLKVGKDLKSLYPNLLHVTCLCHAIHRVAEQIHSDFINAKKFVSKFSKILARAPRRQNLLSLKIGAPVHSLPVVTRWGTWLSFCGLLHKYFDKIKEFIVDIEDEDNSSIQMLGELSQSDQLRQELIEVDQFQHLVRIISELEESGLNIYRQKELLEEARGGLPLKYQDKLRSSLSKNPDIETIFNLQDHETATKYSFAPLVSVDVERSFSILKNILTCRRHRFTASNFKMYSISQIYASNEE